MIKFESRPIPAPKQTLDWRPVNRPTPALVKKPKASPRKRARIVDKATGKPKPTGKRAEYYREYMRKRRAEAKLKGTKA